MLSSTQSAITNLRFSARAFGTSLHEPLTGESVPQEVKSSFKGTETTAASLKVSSDVGREKERVLLVEDEDAVRSLISNMLARKGYQVIEGESGEQALEVFDQKERLDRPGPDGYRNARYEGDHFGVAPH